MSSSLNIIVVLGAILLVLTSTFVAQAEGRSLKELSSCSSVRVHVRTLMGKSERVEDGVSSEVVLDERLQDLQKQIQALHYTHYSLLSEKTAVVPVSKRRVLNLSDGHKLTVRPLYVNDERVGLWMKWRDGNGMEVLDSRMHFKCGEHVLTGLEMNENRGLVLAIHVSPIEEEPGREDRK
jgi:hypothetical protein